ncbi:MAG: DUF2156 domain-containing protein [Actinobacteria bacterium]|nr:DUF2156 domain-containing protein [Actinomycetota bacterium]
MSQLEWRPLLVSDKQLLDRWARRFGSFAEATFVTLSLWNPIARCRIASCGDLVFIEHGGVEGTRVVTPLGGATPAAVSARVLLDAGYSLRYVPEPTIGYESREQWRSLALNLREEPEEFDYILDLTELATLQGNRFRGKRKRRNSFERLAGRPTFQQLDPSRPRVVSEVLGCARTWAAAAPTSASVTSTEIEGLEQLLGGGYSPHELGILTFGIYIDDGLVAFCVVETHGTPTVSGVCFKALRSWSGAAEYLRSASAVALLKLGYNRINIQQDLGIEGLRVMKQSYRPCSMHRKWAIDLAEMTTC